MIDQAIIFGTGVCATWLSQDVRPSRQRWACVFGLIGQPAWFYTTWQAEQWGVFALAFVFTAAWGRGLWNFWLRGRFA